MFANTPYNHVPVHPSPDDARRHRWHAWQQWTVMGAVGELLGFGIPALVGAGAYALRLPDSVLNIAVIVAGMVLGLTQWLVLRRYVPQLDARAWVLVTGAGALLVWTLGMGWRTLAQAYGS
jgi:hypothetical protein